MQHASRWHAKWPNTEFVVGLVGITALLVAHLLNDTDDDSDGGGDVVDDIVMIIMVVVVVVVM